MSHHYLFDVGRFLVTPEAIPEFSPELEGIPLTENILIGADTVNRPGEQAHYGKAPSDYTLPRMMDSGLQVEKKVIIPRYRDPMPISRIHGEVRIGEHGAFYEHRSNSAGIILYLNGNVYGYANTLGTEMDLNWEGSYKEEHPLERYLLLGSFEMIPLQLVPGDMGYYIKITESLPIEGVTGG